MKLFVSSGGLWSSVQDLGRSGLQRFGIGPGGAMDGHALQVANLLVGNSSNEAGIEMTLRGVDVTFDEDAVVAVCGGDFAVSVDGTPVPMWRKVSVPRGAHLRIGAAAKGCRAYLAVKGSWQVPSVLGSKSTNLYAGFGGVEGRALRSGDEIDITHPLGDEQQCRDASLPDVDERSVGWSTWSIAHQMRSPVGPEFTIRVLPGPDACLLGAEAEQAFYTQSYEVTTAANRMGIQLQGEPLTLRHQTEPVSKPVVTGAIQRLHSGQLTVLLADRQTTGGYPVVGVVAACDLSKLAQAQPGARIWFTPITHAESLRLRARAQTDMFRLACAIKSRCEVAL